MGRFPWMGGGLTLADMTIRTHTCLQCGAAIWSADPVRQSLRMRADWSGHRGAIGLRTLCPGCARAQRRANLWGSLALVALVAVAIVWWLSVGHPWLG